MHVILTGNGIEINYTVHPLRGHDHLVEQRHATTGHARVSRLWAHSYAPVVAVL